MRGQIYGGPVVELEPRPTRSHGQLYGGPVVELEPRSTHNRGQLYGGPVVEARPQPAAAQSVSVDPIELLGQQHSKQLERLETEFGQQEGELKGAFENQFSGLEGQYNIERRYIEQAEGVDREQKVKQLQQLNKKYELKLNDLQSRFDPHMQELAGQKQQALAEINAQRGRQEMEITVIDRLVQQGVITDPAAAMQQKLQAIGVNIPISQLRQPRPEDIVKDAKQELRAVEDVLNYFEPGDTGAGWFKSEKPPRLRVFNPELGTEELVDLTPEQKELLRDTIKRQRELQNIIAKQSVGAFLFSNAMNEAGDLKRSPMADKVAELLEQSGGKKNSSDPLGLGL